MTRVATLAQFNSALFHLQKTQTNLNDLQIQISSGTKSQDYTSISRDSGRLVSMENTHVRVSQYIENNTLVERRLQTMETNLSQVQDIASSLKTLLVNALNSGNATELNLTAQGQGMLNQLAALLNVEQDGRFLFSGSRTDTAPVDLTGLPVSYTVPTADGDASGYYQGDSNNLTVRADDLFDVSYGVNAGQAPFERLIRAVDLIIKSPPTDTAALNDALAAANEAIDTLPDVRTQIGNARKTLSETNGRHNEFLLYLEENVGDLQNTDVTESIAKLNENQVSLEAAYMTLTRLSNVSLLNFLR